jgi:hypothetical protein
MPQKKYPREKGGYLSGLGIIPDEDGGCPLDV